MKWACCIIVLLLLVLPLVSSQVDPSDPNPSLTQQQSDPYAGVNLAPELVKALMTMEQKIAQDIKDYNDENFVVLDQRVAEYIIEVSRSTQIRAIVGILGVNLVVAGLAFYWLNKQNRKLSYESADQRKRQSNDDRKYIVENLNHIRDRMDYLEQEARQRVDTSVIPTEDLDKGFKRERVEEDFDKNLNEFVNSHGGVENGGRQEEAYGNYMGGQAPAEKTYSEPGTGEFYQGSERQRAEERFV